MKLQLDFKKLWEWFLIPVIIFSIATALLTYPMILHLKNGVPDMADPLLNAWILAWDAHAFVTNPLGLYNANSFYPYTNTLAYSETLLGQALFAAPIIWITGNPILALNVCWMMAFVFSGFTMYVLVNDLTGSKLASIIAGMIFTFNSFRFAHIVHLQLLSVQWIPLCIFFMRRLLRKQRWIDWLCVWICFNLQALSCYYYAFFTAVALGGLVLSDIFISHLRITRRFLIQLIGLVLCIAVLQIPLALPYFKVAASMNFERSFTDVVMGGADLADFLTSTPDNVLFGDLTSNFRGEGWWEHVTFPGLVTVGLVVFALIRKKPQRDKEHAAIFGVLALLGFILSLGPVLRLNGQQLLIPLPYRLLFEIVPGFRAIRQPARFHVITMTGLSVVAGMGSKFLLQSLAQNAHRILLTGLLLGYIGLENWGGALKIYTVPLASEIPPVYQWLGEQPGDGPVLELPVLLDVGHTEALRLYYSTIHWKRMINGYGGFYPPTYAYFLFFDHEFPSQPYDWIVGLGTQYVILHRGQYSSEELQAIDEDLLDFEGRLNLVAEFGTDQVYEVIQPVTGHRNRPNLEQTLSEKVRLLGYVVKSSTTDTDTILEVKLFWQCLQSMEKDYTVFVHLLDENGNLIAQHDGQPNNGDTPTSACLLEEVIVDSHVLQLSSSTIPDVCVLHVGLYDLQTMQRLPVQDVDGIISNDFLDLGRLRFE
jgi:hypothetical protein